MAKGVIDLEQEILECWNITRDIKDVYEFLDSPFFEDMEPKHADKLTNLLSGISELYEIKFEKMWNTFEECVHNRNV